MVSSEREPLQRTAGLGCHPQAPKGGKLDDIDEKINRVIAMVGAR